MKLNGLNQWLTLIANLAVLIGIVVVSIELRQNQVSMQAEASAMRAQMAIANEDYLASIPLELLIQMEGEGLGELSPDDRLKIFPIFSKLLRYFENLHYQYQLEVLDDEIWQANLNGISSLCGSLRTVLPSLFSDTASNGFNYRESFIDLLRSTCTE